MLRRFLRTIHPIHRLRQALGRTKQASPWSSPAPIREELFGIHRLEEHARTLAVAQTVTPGPSRGRPLVTRVGENATALRQAYRSMQAAIDKGHAITPAAEWLIDNFHLVEMQVWDIRANLPTSYYRQLPKLASGPFMGYPRVFGMAWAFIAHTDSRFDPELLLRYACAYQQEQPLTIGELWALSITLRIVLIENLTRVARQIVRNRIAREQADALADRLLGTGEGSAEPISAVLACHEHITLSGAFVVQLIHRLRDQDPRVIPALTWLDQRLAAQDMAADAVVRDVHMRQGTSNVTMRNIITSLRLIAGTDWKDLFERMSLVDEELGSGPFRDMDFQTRTLYRSAIEELARGSDRTEIDIARHAVLAARQAQASLPAGGDQRSADPGYHLLAGGRRAFEAAVGFRLPWRAWPTQLNRTFGIGGYAVLVACTTAILLALPLSILATIGLGAAWLELLAALGAIPATDAAVAIANLALAFGLRATALPAMELRGGVPSHLSTLVVIPTLLTTRDAIAEQIEHLEIHYLASPEGDLHFALLTDWTDATSEHVESDEVLHAAATEGITRLNRKYGPAPGGARFSLLHRRRVWNTSEARWIGWERKRGKLHELNRLLRGATDTTFVDSGGTGQLLAAGIRYVITLDADTRLPRDTVRRLIGKMAHPLNRPSFDAATGRVVEGYAVLQPRVTPSLPIGQEGSLFQRIFSSLSGIDPYASAASDVYQDLFGEGSYTGKGIYDVDAFEASLAGRVPESTLLSHDLFEGVFARAGLASDVEVVEEFPARYDVGALRHHRWARGDWQLLPWILGCAPKPAGASHASAAIPLLGRFKMLDNLRRTLSAAAAVLALFAGWAAPFDAGPFDAGLIWTVFVLLAIALPALIPVIIAIPPCRPGPTMASHMRALGGDLRLALTLSAMNVTFLAHQAWLMGDAILRTLWRLFVTRRHLMEWVTAAQATNGRRLNLAGFYSRMYGSLVVAAAGTLVAIFSEHGSWALMGPVLLLWTAAPAVAWWASQPPGSVGQLAASAAEARSLRLTARRTWRFFETFVTPADHMLPPDNFQEDPAPALAHRTSPTNLGLYLLSVVCARDFGWIGTADAVTRLQATLEVMDGLARFRGHFYNWYDTKDLRPLDPQYISTVDSGNLAGHLIALANACLEWQNLPFAATRRLTGVVDAVDLACEEAECLRDGRLTQGTVTWRQFDDAVAELRRAVAQTAQDAGGLGEGLAVAADLAATVVDIAHAIGVERGDGTGDDMLFWAKASLKSIEQHRDDLACAADGAVTSTKMRLAAIEASVRAMALAMEFGFLLDDERQLLSIGYRPAEGKLDESCYDLLASEARLASFVAIAKGDVPARHWFRLGRSVTPVMHRAALISWSGSMFEYLMPSLVMRAPAGSLLEQTSQLAVHEQIAYAATLGLPWGISESAYNARDIEFTYQYSNFGVPGLALKRGLGEHRVVAPYATALAAMVDPRAACFNFSRLVAAGARGRYGFYEALDYTPLRVPTGLDVAVVGAFMAHHQGMTIVAIGDALLDGVMRARFHAEPCIQATELLLQERTPRDVAVARRWSADEKVAGRIRGDEPSGGRRFTSVYQATPATLLLSNGSYVTMLTAAGSGYSRWRDIAVTRWREDATCDDHGSYIFVRDVRSGAVWSAGFQPTGVVPDDYAVTFNEDRAVFSRRDGTLSTRLEVLVSTEDDAEVRRISISNTGSRSRECDITTYAEIVLAQQDADLAHPAFSKLFVETEYLDSVGAILATRRRRAPTEPEIWAAHLAVVDGEGVGKMEIETDRARFLGRGHGIGAPVTMIEGRSLSNTVGAVLDPIFALRRRVRIFPGATVHVAFWTMVAPTRAAVLDLIDKRRDTMAFGRAATLSWTQAQVQLHHLGIRAGEASLFQRLAGYVIYAGPVLRPASATIRLGAGAQSALWAQGISGDLPIVLLRIADSEHLEMTQEVLRAHEYWRMKQLQVDLVILNERQSSYVQDLQVAIETFARASQSRPSTAVERSSGRVFVLRADLISAEAHALLMSVARVVLVAQRGSLFDQLERIVEAKMPAGRTPPRVPAGAEYRYHAPAAIPSLEFFNGLGGFAKDGTEYVTILGPGQWTPAPWINVIANPFFGFQVATEGSGYTWSVSSRENQLTPWSNDPVTDRPGEAIYLRDDDTGDVWTPTALPIRDDEGTYVARHGRGYSQFEHVAHGIEADLVQFVPIDAPIKISRLVLRNRSDRARHLSVVAYVEWVLGRSRSASLPFVTTEIDSATGAMLARNPWNGAFGSRVAFLDMGGAQTDWTGIRLEFLGRHGTLANPAALDGGPLSNRVGAGLDPCGAMRTQVALAPNGSVGIVVFLGEAASAEAAGHLVAHYRAADLDLEQAKVARFWNDVLGTIQVRTPDRSLDIMLNGWLLYQTLACRIWARSGFYQASGAYGFRDQLQDGLALVASQPLMVREHLLRAAARQFAEGDVQHWWLPHSGQGVRSRISDDRVWLAYTVRHYVGVTGDIAILDEQVPFLEGQSLAADEQDNFFQPTVSDQTATLFDHCARAIDQSLALGQHGLPLMGTGDWNDGMNRVGAAGTGESVWLGWLLYTTLTGFADLADMRLDTGHAATWRAHATSLQAALEREAWDGGWYRRGFFDDGTPLGSATSEECRIDSIAQSWAVLSGAAEPERAARAMLEVERQLIRPRDGIALLFAPPFDKGVPDPGYIKGYPPGIRENGGQYTHAALWSVMAFVALGEGDKAAALLSLLNPINHARTRADLYRYKVEPYAVAADVYAIAPHVGRGGWTWYTGSAGWMQRAGVESLLGLRMQEGVLHLDPCIPCAWPGFDVSLRYGEARYDIRVENPDGSGQGVCFAAIDQTVLTARPLGVRLVDDGAIHLLQVHLGR